MLLPEDVGAVNILPCFTLDAGRNALLVCYEAGTGNLTLYYWENMPNIVSRVLLEAGQRRVRHESQLRTRKIKIHWGQESHCFACCLLRGKSPFCRSVGLEIQLPDMAMHAPAGNDPRSALASYSLLTPFLPYSSGLAELLNSPSDVVEPVVPGVFPVVAELPRLVGAG